MSCESIRSILDLHVEGRLTSGWSARVAAHLGRCPACAARAEALRPKPAAAAAAPASLKDRLRRAAAAGARGPLPTGLPPLPRRSELPAALLALALAGLAVAVFHLIAPAVSSERPVSRVAPVVWRLP